MILDDRSCEIERDDGVGGCQAAASRRRVQRERAYPEQAGSAPPTRRGHLRLIRVIRGLKQCRAGPR